MMNRAFVRGYYCDLLFVYPKCASFNALVRDGVTMAWLRLVCVCVCVDLWRDMPVCTFSEVKIGNRTPILCSIISGYS